MGRCWDANPPIHDDGHPPINPPTHPTLRPGRPCHPAAVPPAPPALRGVGAGAGDQPLGLAPLHRRQRGRPLPHPPRQALRRLDQGGRGARGAGGGGGGGGGGGTFEHCSYAELQGQLQQFLRRNSWPHWHASPSPGRPAAPAPSLPPAHHPWQPRASFHPCRACWRACGSAASLPCACLGRTAQARRFPATSCRRPTAGGGMIGS